MHKRVHGKCGKQCPVRLGYFTPEEWRAKHPLKRKPNPIPSHYQPISDSNIRNHGACSHHTRMHKKCPVDCKNRDTDDYKDADTDDEYDSDSSTSSLDPSVLKEVNQEQAAKLRTEFRKQAIVMDGGAELFFHFITSIC
jgi:hypothetical protein